MTASDALATVTDVLMADHRRMDCLMKECAAAVADGEQAAALVLFERFRAGLTRHIKIEEGILFPEYEIATGTSRSAGPTSVMRHEHEEILAYLGSLNDLLSLTEFQKRDFDDSRNDLVSLLHEHNLKEEEILYPACDHLISKPRLRELLETISRF